MTIELDLEGKCELALKEVWKILYPDGEPFEEPSEVPEHLRVLLKNKQDELAQWIVRASSKVAVALHPDEEPPPPKQKRTRKKKPNA